MIARLALLLALALLPACGAAAALDRTAADEMFAAAGVAYDQGRYQDAIAAYQALLDGGMVSAALLYNLGNAWYRAGDPGQAVLHYRRAGRLAPRDPDIRSNLSFVLQQTEAVSPPVSPLRDTLLLIRRGEWATLAMAAYWLLALLFGAGLFSARLRALFRRAAAPGLLALLLAMLGLWAWSREQIGREQVVIAPEQQTRFAPLDDAQPHFEVPPGSIVACQETEGDWIRVTVGERTGWLKASVCTGVDNVPYL